MPRSQDLCWEGCRLQALRLAPEKVSLRATKLSRQRVLSRHWDLECQAPPLPPPFSTDVSVSRAPLGETVGGKSAATRGPPGWGRRHLLRPMNGVQCWGAVVSNTVFSCAGDPPARTPLLCHCRREEEPHPDSRPRWALGAQGAQIHPTPGQPAPWTSRQPALRREPSLTREPRGTRLIAAPHLLPSLGP